MEDYFYVNPQHLLDTNICIFLVCAKVHLLAKENCTCDVCDQTFKTQQCLDQHMFRNHQAKEILTCNVCDQTFKTQQCLRLDEHGLKNHQAKDMLTCIVCDQTFETQ